MITRRKMILCIMAVIIGISGMIGAAYLLTGSSRKSFGQDGYVLEITEDENGQSVTGLNFASGTDYTARFPSSFAFRDIEGKKQVVKETSYIHYTDGSISAFAPGMAVNMTEINTGFLDFFRLGAGMVMSDMGEGWQIDSNGRNMDFTEFLWQVSKDQILTASRKMRLELPGRTPETISGYLEIQWLDQDIVRVAAQDQAWQVMAGSGKVVFDSGAVLDLHQKAVLGSDGQIRFTLDELWADLDSEDTIVIRSDSYLSWKAPEFHIQSQDGENGEEGQSGDDGEAGDAGQAGEAGEAGEEGEEGQSGDEGEEGQEGDDGNTGANGSQGAAGQNGEGGERGASPGGSGSSGSSMESALGAIHILEIQLDNGSGTAAISYSDPYQTLKRNTGVIEIRDAVNNQLVYRKDNLDFSSLSNQKVAFENLSGDKEYLLLLKNDYEIEIGGTINKGTRTFAQRSFYTGAEGVFLQLESVKEGMVEVRLVQQGVQRNPYFKIRVKVGKKGMTASQLLSPGGQGENIKILDFPEEEGLADSLEYYKRDTYLLNIEQRLEGMGYTDSWDSDMPYIIELYTSASDSRDYWMLDEDGEFAGLRQLAWTREDSQSSQNFAVRLSGRDITGRTLKKQPEIGSAQIVYSEEGFYTLSVDVRQNHDSSIRGYTFYIQNAEGNGTVQTLTSDTSSMRWYGAQALDPGTYSLRVVVTYFDNEKVNELTSEPKLFQIENARSDAVTFEPFVLRGDSYYNSRNQLMGSAGKSGLKDGNGIWGELILRTIITGGGSKTISGPLRIVVTSQKDSGYRREFTMGLPAAYPIGSGVYYAAIKCLDMIPDTQYTIWVYGNVTRYFGEDEDIKTEYSENEFLGSCAAYTESSASVNP